MAEPLKLQHPWLVAAWPGMGHVALNAAYYLLAKLEMHVIAEYEARDLFDIDQVEVKDGIIQPARRPRNRFFVWTDPKKKHDLVVFLGEAQPPIGKYAFCQKLIEYAHDLNIERVITFAAMATQMLPNDRSRTFAAATDAAGLEQLKGLDLEVLEDGHIGGLNGVLLAAAAEGGLRGACLLGEMPHLFIQLPYPKASLTILEVFSTIMKIDLDFSELTEQARVTDEKLADLLERVESMSSNQASGEEESPEAEPAEEEPLESADRKRIEDLFTQSRKDRSKAFELKRELDRLGIFKEFEDRFLDLFKKRS